MGSFAESVKDPAFANLSRRNKNKE
jgi:hypothetical protein